ncbi:thiamine permease (plasmid) [Halorientalis sp. IM1011]|uniref:NCS1 family transporter n=1 Tax=Halorientalis sp. IM1011 TaxID=1932360 RepID=UPI00097CD167|nr:NCS1 family transporter [Halorientalis sp. IM1011]AQL44774.1 thiamine permease [Halorientalis sp. IM1011]
MSEDSKPEGLAPIPWSERTMSLLQYPPVWWSSLIVVQSFAVAFFAVYPQGGLNLLQVTLAAAIGTLILSGLFIMNGFPGYEEGIPFAMQTRSAFGIKGATIPNYLRITPAIAWLGIGNWIGALAIQTISTTLWGFGNVWVYFALFLILNVILAWYGIESIKWFNFVASGVIIVLMTYTAYIVLSTEGIPTEVITYGGSWSWEFVAVISVMVGQVITGALNASDLTRHLEVSGNGSARNQVLGHIIGIIPPYLFMMLIGILFGVSAGNPNPIEAVMEVAPNPILGSLMLLFVVLAQISTNLTMNILPPANVFQDTFGVSWKQGVVATGVLSVATFPWMLFTSDLFYTFISFYAAFLGPIIGILMADYWIVKRRETDVDELYDKSADSKFWFVRGFSVTGIVSMVLGTVVSLPYLDMGWMIGLPVGFASYLLLTKFALDDRVKSYMAPAAGARSTPDAD